MASVYFDPAVGGDGTTVTDDTNPTTGLDAYGYTTRLVPAFGQVVALANYAKGRATAADASAIAAAAAASSALNAPGTNATSTTSLAIGTGDKSFTIQIGKAYVTGQTLVAASAADPANFMAGQVKTHNPATGALVITVTQTGGSGTRTDWVISMAAIVSSTLPSQTGNNGKFLTTNGTSASWGDVLVPSGNLSGLANYTTARSNMGLAIGTNVQAYDAKLAAFSGLTGAANKLAYFTGASAMAVADLSADGRTLIGGANFAAMRTSLSLVAGTNVQAYSANLAALAGLTLAANKLPYATGSGAMALTDLSAFARTFLDDASAGDVRTTLGAAASGANNDITSLNGVTTPISATQGGTGVASLDSMLNALPVTGGAAGEFRLGTLYIKWGSASVTAAHDSTSGEALVTFTTAFPTACAAAWQTPNLPSGSLGGNQAFGPYVRSLSASSVRLGLDAEESTPLGTYTCYWIAIGY